MDAANTGGRLRYHRGVTGRTAFLSPGSRLTAIYFAVQALLGLAWWIGLGISDAFREVFTPSGYPETHIATFLIADAVLFVGGSALTAVLAYRRSPRVVAFQFVTLGAVLYATLHCLGLVVEAGDQWPAAVLMGWSSVGTLVFATLSRPSHGGLPSFPMRTYRFGSRRAVLATVLQIIAVWGVFLLLIPWHVRLDRACDRAAPVSRSAHRRLGTLRAREPSGPVVRFDHGGSLAAARRFRPPPRRGS